MPRPDPCEACGNSHREKDGKRPPERGLPPSLLIPSRPSPAESPVVRPGTAPAAAPASPPKQFLTEAAAGGEAAPAAQEAAAAPAEPEWSQEPEVPAQRPAVPEVAAARAAVATSLEGFSDSRPQARSAQSRRDIEDYNRRIATRLREELARERLSAGSLRCVQPREKNGCCCGRLTTRAFFFYSLPLRRRPTGR